MTKYYVVMSKKEDVATIYFNFQKSVPPIRFRGCTHIQIAPSKWQTVNKSHNSMKEDAENNLLHCVLYYISMGGGFVRSAKHLSKLLHSAKGNSQMMEFVPTVIGKMTEVSVKHGHDKQSDWKELTHDADDEVSKEVRHG